MNVLRTALKYLLKSDPILEALLGFDQYGGRRIYEAQAPNEVNGPYVVWTLVPGTSPQGQYGDLHAIMNLSFQLSHWSLSRDHVYQLADTTFEILDESAKEDWDIFLAPWYLMSISAAGDSRLLVDRESGYLHVPATYDVAIGRG